MPALPTKHQVLFPSHTGGFMFCPGLAALAHVLLALARTASGCLLLVPVLAPCQIQGTASPITMAGWKAAVAVALLACLCFSAVDASSKQKKKAVVTHKVRAALATRSTHFPWWLGFILQRAPCCRSSSTLRSMESQRVRQLALALQHAAQIWADWTSGLLRSSRPTFSTVLQPAVAGQQSCCSHALQQT